MKKSESHPKILPDQYKVIIMESTSGIILNVRLDYANPSEPKYYTFPSLEEARQFINLFIRPNTAFMILDSEEKIVEETSIPPEKPSAKKGFLAKLLERLKK